MAGKVNWLEEGACSPALLVLMAGPSVGRQGKARQWVDGGDETNVTSGPGLQVAHGMSRGIS